MSTRGRKGRARKLKIAFGRSDGMQVVSVGHAQIPRIRIDEVAGIADKSEEFRFGSVTVEAIVPTEQEVKRNIELGQNALRRASEALAKRGVRISVSKGVPLFHVDPKEPDVLIRVLDGKRERGRFRDGEFTVES